MDNENKLASRQGSQNSDQVELPSVLEAEHLEVGYDDHIVLSEMNVEIPRGKITTIIGPNGCGKSTLLKAMARIIPHSKGVVLLDGKDMAKIPTVEIARKMALLPQSPQAPSGLLVKELVSYGRYPYQKGFGTLSDTDHAIINQAMALTRMEEFKDRDVDALSGGQRQRAWIAMALAQDTPVILLDEPTTYLDMAHQLEILQLLERLNKEEHKTIALVIHDLNLAARFADWMIAMRDGKVLHEGTAQEIMTKPVLEEVFGLDAFLQPDPWTGRPVMVSYRIAQSANAAEKESV